MLLHLDFSLDVPIYQQIRNEVVLAIASGKLEPGMQMPPVRTLAETLGVNMMTVHKAYSLLKQEGYLITDRRAGTVVSAGHSKVISRATQTALALAVAEAKAAGIPLQMVLAICREAYDQPGKEVF